MSDTKRWYLGMGKEFVKAQCKEYKTLEGAMKAASKNPDFVVWDENGNPAGTVKAETVAQAAGNAAEGEEKTEEGKEYTEEGKAGNEANTDAQKDGAEVNGGSDEEGQQDASRIDTEGGTEQETEKSTPKEEKTGNEENTSAQERKTIVPDGNMRVMVVCDGSLNLRRSAAWGNDNICGRAIRGQTYHVKAIHTVEGKKMVETIDGIFLSGQSEHVQFEQL